MILLDLVDPSRLYIKNTPIIITIKDHNSADSTNGYVQAKWMESSMYLALYTQQS